jgi:hypothetical protein
LNKIKLALKFYQTKQRKSRYRFILGQLYEELGKKDSAIYSYESVINMNRKSKGNTLFKHKLEKQLFDYQNGYNQPLLKTLKADCREKQTILRCLKLSNGCFLRQKWNQKKKLDFIILT